jgi:hypothetical protein
MEEADSDRVLGKVETVYMQILSHAVFDVLGCASKSLVDCVWQAIGCKEANA